MCIGRRRRLREHLDHTNEANLDAETGGLRIWNKKPPADWTFETANRDLDAIGSILQDGEASHVTIPYRFNRAVFLNGHRFHQTDSLHFAPGLDNHRINLTFLFARRSDGTAPGLVASSRPCKLLSIPTSRPSSRRVFRTGPARHTDVCHIAPQVLSSRRGDGDQAAKVVAGWYIGKDVPAASVEAGSCRSKPSSTRTSAGAISATRRTCSTPDARRPRRRRSRRRHEHQGGDPRISGRSHYHRHRHHRHHRLAIVTSFPPPPGGHRPGAPSPQSPTPSADAPSPRDSTKSPLL